MGGVGADKEVAEEVRRRHAIYSVDIQLGGGRLATGGGDSNVKVWSLPALLGSPDHISSQGLLATLGNHSKSVNIVRWSPDGAYLASGSDDNYVLIYKLATGAATATGTSFGSKAEANREAWVRCCSLHGHSMVRSPPQP